MALDVLNSSSKNCSIIKFTVEVPRWKDEPVGSVGFRLTIFCIVFLCSLIGNSVVVKAIRERPHLKKPFPYFVVTSMAVAELVGTICLPFFQVYEELMTWPFGDAMCGLVNACMLTSYFVIPWSLATIAFLRFRTFSQRHIFMISGKRIVCFVSILWLSGIIISAPTYIFAVQVKTAHDNHSYWCIELFPGDTLTSWPSPSLRKYFFIRFVLNFVLPGAIIVIAYGGVALKLKRHLIASSLRHNHDDDGEAEPQTTLSTVHNTSTSDSLGNPATAADTTPPENNTDNNRQERTSQGEQLKEIEYDLLRMIYVIILIYLCCYIPYQAFFLMEHFGFSVLVKWRYFIIVRKYVYLLSCFPSALHPVCYGTMSRFYAQVFSRLILCKKGG